jgi:lipopolysaccharide export system permease protein
VRSGWTAWKIFKDYYLSFIPHIIALLFPLFVFIAVIFFTSKMAGRSEIIAILASGISYNRFLRPFLLTGLGLSLLLAVAASFIVPPAEVKRTFFEDVYVGSNSTYNQITAHEPVLYFKTDSITYNGIHHFDAVNKSGGPFFLYRLPNEKNAHGISYNLRSASIRWDTAHGGSWLLQNVVERTFGKNGVEKVAYYPQKKMYFTFDPSELHNDDYAEVKLTTPQLVRRIQRENLRGGEDVNTFKIELYHRFTTPVSVLILTMIGAVIASRRVRGGSGAHLAIGFVLAATFIVMDKFSTVFSTKGNFSPALAAWLPDIIFAIVAIYLYRKAPK